MPDDWRTVTLEAIADPAVPITYGVVQPGAESPGGVRFVRSGDVVGGRVLVDQLRTISQEVHQQYARTQLRGGELLVSLVGNPGQVAIAPADLAGANVARQVGVVRLLPSVDSRFVVYSLMSAQGVQELFANTLGSVQQVINLKELRQVRLALPPLDQQHAISNLLGALDDKIDLNRRMNHTLGEMALALFRSWFVDFDPVVAKAASRTPFGMDAATAALFPCSFEDSKLGPIPRGWRVGRLDEVLVLQRGFDLPSSLRVPGPFPVIAAGGVHGTHNKSMVRGPGVCTGRSGVLGNVYYVHEDFWPLNTSLWVKEFKNSTPAYAFHLLRRLDFVPFNAGSAVPTLNRNHVHGLPTLVAPMNVVREFDAAAGMFLQQEKAAEEESRTLAALRDTLLPKLLSGEIRLRNAERAVEAVA